MTGRPRGRPRRYDPDIALGAALQAFWQGGYAATTLDDISAATGMNRPSLYAAFGDKKSIYRKTLAKFNAEFLGALEAALFSDGSLPDDLIGFYRATLPTYLAGQTGGLGCPVLCTAPAEAAADDDIRADLTGALDWIDQTLIRRMQQARDTGELPPSTDAERLGRLAAALLHSLALRTRAGQAGFDADAFIRSSVDELLADRPGAAPSGQDL